MGYRAAAVLVMTVLAASGALAASPIQEGTLVHLADGDVQGGVNGGRREFLGIASPPRRSGRSGGARDPRGRSFFLAWPA